MKKTQLWLASFITLGLIAFETGHLVQALDSDNKPATIQTTIEKAALSERVSVQAAGRGNPWINLSDGHELITSYLGPAELVQALERNEAQGLSLASADFDEDGVPDLISGYAGPQSGIVTLMRGNVDSIYPNAPQAKQRKAEGAFTDAPFLAPAFVFEVPEAADFIGTGDFDADGHWDVVAAARGGNDLWFFRGDGQGSFGEAIRIDLHGRVTNLITGEINRADGLADIVVGVVAADGPKVLVFESPDGALRGNPEAHALRAEVTAIALGRLDSDYTMDLVVGSGSDLVVVYGRDRKLSLDEIKRAEVPKAEIYQRSFPYAIKAAAIGDFMGDGQTGLSLLSDDGAVYLLSGGRPTGRNVSDRIEDWKSGVVAPDPSSRITQLVRARVSSAPADNLVGVYSNGHRLRIIVGSTDPRLQEAAKPVWLDVDGEPVSVLPMRVNAYALSDLVVLRKGQIAPSMVLTPSSIITVTNTDDNGPGSLRQAILDANANPGLDTITFSIGSGVQTINVGSMTGLALPTITSPVNVDGTTQPGYAGAPLIELNGINAPHDVNDAGSGNGLFITAGSSTIKGLVINRFEGLGIRIEPPGGNIIAANYIGTDVSGTVALGNALGGVFIVDSPNNTIGGTAAGARNVISGNESFGIDILGNFAPGNLVQGNYIGTDASGTADLGNGEGLFVAPNTTVGGTTPGARNIISGNDTNGIDISNGSVGILVQGNYIGTIVNGTAGLANANDGMAINGGDNNTIGGTVVSARNVISGNNRSGIEMLGSATGNLVQGNFIGTDVNGTAALSNSIDSSGDTGGVLLANGPSNNTIGGSASGARNIISGNNSFGIELVGVTGTFVQGNYIGTDFGGTSPLGNLAAGVLINASPNNTIGGQGAGVGNIISGNGAGVDISGGPSSRGDLVHGNYIGTNSTGQIHLGNLGDGVFINDGTTNASIQNNFIAFNGGNAVRIPNAPNLPATGENLNNTVVQNSIFSNVVPIDLGPAGATKNDARDPDTGANLLQNYPTLISVTLMNGVLHIVGSFNSTPNSNFWLDFYTSDQCTESNPQVGQRVIALGLLFHTNENGDAAIDKTFTVTNPGGFVNALARDAAGNTSEFCQCAPINSGISCNYSLSTASASYASNGGPGSVNVTTTSTCNWTAVSNDTFITLISGIDGPGNGTLNYSVQANVSATARLGTMTIAGQTFTVNQAGASV
ncbi:MAG: FG-GAP-like repeat-containing protein, partial [Blastocatellia bacterium]